MKLRDGCPVIDGRGFYSPLGEKVFSFSVALQCDELGLNPKAVGCVCPDESRAREDAAYNLLDLVLKATSTQLWISTIGGCARPNDKLQTWRMDKSFNLVTGFVSSKQSVDSCYIVFSLVDVVADAMANGIGADSVSVSGWAVIKMLVRNTSKVRWHLGWPTSLWQAMMPRKGRDNAKQKGRRKERAKAKGTTKNAVPSDSSRYGSLHHFLPFVDVVLSRWGPRKLSDVPRICRELPTIAEEEVTVVDQQLLDSLADLKQEIRRKEHSLLTTVNASTSETGSLKKLVTQQGEAIQVLTAKVEALEGKQSSTRKETSATVVVDLKDGGGEIAVSSEGVNKLKSRSTFRILADLAGVVCQDVSGVSEASDVSREEAGICSLLGRGHEYPLQHEAEFLDIVFRPPAGMRFIGTELAIAAYIFARRRDENEVLYEDPHCDGSRRRMWSLIPGSELEDDVLNMVVGMCTRGNTENRRWWLPTTFSYNQPTMDYVRERYMGVADKLDRIYVPMHVSNHWYLMIIDLWDKKLVYLDSLISEDAGVTDLRISLMRDVACFLDALMKDSLFWTSSNPSYPCIKDFEPVIPHTGQQVGLRCLGMPMDDECTPVARLHVRGCEHGHKDVTCFGSGDQPTKSPFSSYFRPGCEPLGRRNAPKPQGSDASQGKREEPSE
ncbi:hypothetical protein PIB30_030355 [Stylosanthes scabra]|uniref:Ubiquitin-like protease family profile domain-containing protein n=1 Tax=Stylosanthes scabra TaxID=79078 RepID=A0ABU6VBN7_9FABA|nr:hypothetical protein [Stylosanthes scabra]